MAGHSVYYVLWGRACCVVRVLMTNTQCSHAQEKRGTTNQLPKRQSSNLNRPIWQLAFPTRSSDSKLEQSESSLEPHVTGFGCRFLRVRLFILSSLFETHFSSLSIIT